MNDRKQYVITRIDDRLVGVYMIGERIFDIHITDDERAIKVGNVYVGRVKNVVDNIRAAFVEFREGVMGFLPLSEKQRKSIKPEQELIVQVKKPAFSTKDAVLSTDIELVGRYAVFHSNGGSVLHEDSTKNGSDSDIKPVSKPVVFVKDVNISKKIKDAEMVSRLKELTLKSLGNHVSGEGDDLSFIATNTEQLSPATVSVTVRTNASTADEARVAGELKRLSDEMERILEYGPRRTAFSCLYYEPIAFIRQINRYPSDQIDRIVTDVDSVYEELLECRVGVPAEKNKSVGAVTGIPLVRYRDTYSLDARYAIRTTMEKALDRRVWLKSGANLLIDRTVAMTVIDVNTAKAIEGKRASETTFFKINTEAAEEIARQLRLRNLSGIILVDFIDMKEQDHIDALISHLRSCLKEDPVKTNYIDYTGLGLIEITRARQDVSLYENYAKSQ